MDKSKGGSIQKPCANVRVKGENTLAVGRGTRWDVSMFVTAASDSLLLSSRNQFLPKIRVGDDDDLFRLFPGRQPREARQVTPVVLGLESSAL